MTLKINPFPEMQGLNEVYQSMDLKYAFLKRVGDEEYSECNPLAKCRDYLHDIVNANLTKGTFSIYGMSYSAQKFPIDLDVTRFGLKFPSEADKKTFLENFQELISIETSNDLLASKIMETDKPLYLIVEGDAFWMTNTVLLNLYTYLLRVLCYKNNGPTMLESLENSGATNESNYLQCIGRDRLEKILTQLGSFKTDTFCGYSEEMGTRDLHDFSGIVSFFGKPQNYQCKYSVAQCSSNNAHYKYFKDQGLL